MSESNIDCKFTTAEPVVDDDIFDCTWPRNMYRNLPWAEETIFVVYVATEGYVIYPMIEQYDITDYVSGFGSAQRCMDAWLKEYEDSLHETNNDAN